MLQTEQTERKKVEPAERNRLDARQVVAQSLTRWYARNRDAHPLAILSLQCAVFRDTLAAGSRAISLP
jgi:hypothetical protein